jgi:hypothetical protein
VNDAECLSQDPTLRLIGSEKIWDRGAALTSRLQSFETEVLAQDQNLAGLEEINRDLIALQYANKRDGYSMARFSEPRGKFRLSRKSKITR